MRKEVEEIGKGLGEREGEKGEGREEVKGG